MSSLFKSVKDDNKFSSGPFFFFFVAKKMQELIFLIIPVCPMDSNNPFFLKTKLLPINIPKSRKRKRKETLYILVTIIIKKGDRRIKKVKHTTADG